MNEIEFIDLLRPLAGPGGLNLDDDAGIIPTYNNRGIVTSTDTMVEGIHFPRNRRGGGFAERLLRTALSDLAAKACKPIGYTLNISWPTGTERHWYEGFVRGLKEAQTEFECYLIGGDTTSTSGPLVVSATVFGLQQSPHFLSRSGAQIGDHIYFSGRLGLAAMGLMILQGKPVTLSPEDFAAAEEAYLRPVPRFDLVPLLSKYATSSCDISDGFLFDAVRLAKASQRCFDIGKAYVPNPDGGDDYEILFTASPHVHQSLMSEAQSLGVSLTHCGVVKAGKGVALDGRSIRPEGYRHQF